MAQRKKAEQDDNQSGDSSRQEVRFSVEPGTKIQIAVDVGSQGVDGKVPVTVRVEPVAGEERREAGPVSVPLQPAAPSRLRTALAAVASRMKVLDLASWLFILAVIVYLATRLIGLTQFPIYFFTDEAIQSQSIADLVRNGYRDSTGVLLPTYFRNGDYYNLSLSVYIQWLPYILFGKSAVATRATSVVVTLIAAISIGLILRDIFKLKYWWTGTLFLSITPAWFLHSRTAFETAEFVAFYAGALCAYLFYRYRSPRYLPLAVFLSALAFYTYSPAQMIVPLTAVGLLISDWRYHWENRRTILIGLALIAVLALPYLRYTLDNPTTPLAHLHTLWSYWFEKIPLSEKFARYLSEFGIGLSPWYWYIPNDRDLSRHLMKDYGNIMRTTLPFALLGSAYVLHRIRLPASRTVLIALLVSPAAAALVQVSITRVLVFVVPAAVLTAIGLEKILQWIENPTRQLTELDAGPGPTPARGLRAVLILLIGIPIASVSRENTNRIVLLALTLILAVQASGVLEKLAQALTRAKLWAASPALLATATFAILAGTNIHMLSDALRNGPLWFRDYGMGGMQYGAFQIFDIIKQYLREAPDTRIIFSPDWANGTDVVARFFLGDPLPIQIGSVQGHLSQKLPLDDNTLFIVTPHEYDLVRQSEKLTDIRVERVLPYPDGSPGFHFLRMRYVENIDEIFAAEKAARQALQETTIAIDGQEVKVRFSYLDSDFQAEWMALVFDGDPFTVAKTLESNPFIIEMTFPAPRTLNGFSIIIGSAKVQITLKCFPAPDAQPTIYTFEGQGTQDQPELSFDLPEPARVQILRVETLDMRSSEQAKVHIWELRLR